MKSMLKSKLIELLNNHRDNDVVIGLDDQVIPIASVGYSSIGDHIVIKLDSTQTQIVKSILGQRELKKRNHSAVQSTTKKAKKKNG